MKDSVEREKGREGKVRNDVGRREEEFYAEDGVKRRKSGKE